MVIRESLGRVQSNGSFTDNNKTKINFYKKVNFDLDVLVCAAVRNKQSAISCKPEIQTNTILTNSKQHYTWGLDRS